MGTWASYFGVNNHSLSAGRMFTDGENQGRRRVAVVGALVGGKLGASGGSLLGQSVQVGGVPSEVVGVLAEKGAAGFSNPDEAVYIPLATAQQRVMGSDRLRSIGVQAVDGEQMQAAMAEIDQVLRREHRIRPGESADFDIRDQASLLTTMQETTQTFTFLLAGVAALSLLVGGIGHHEHHARFGGGALGLLLGAGGSMALARMAGWNMAISPASLVLAFGFSAAVGIFFGIWPARRAASLAPIEALRYE